MQKKPPLWKRWLHRLRHFPRVYRGLFLARTYVIYGWFGFWRRVLPARLEFGLPKGWFFLVEQVRAGKCPGRIVLEQQAGPQPGPDSLRVRAATGQDRQVRWPIFWSRHDDARLVGPSLVLQNERKQLAVEAAYGPGFVQADPAYQQFRRPPAVHLGGAWTSVISNWSDGFYHWFMDALPRLALLPEFPADTQVLVLPRLQPYHRDTLEWLGLKGRIRPTPEQHLTIEHYYFASPTNITGLFDPFAVEFLRRSFRHRADVTYDPPRRFFLHRVNAARGIANEAEVLRFFDARGWPIIDAETLSLARQIQLFARAEHVCALHGAGLTNLLWCQPRCRVLELAAGTFQNGVYEGLSEAVGVNYEFLLCPGDAELRAIVDLAGLEKRLA